jgi:hypothetical protein
VSARRQARAAQAVAGSEADALVSLDSPVWATAAATVRWLDARSIPNSRLPGLWTWERLYPGARHHAAARLWAIHEGITKSFGDARWPDIARLREMGIPMTESHALKQTRYDRENGFR